MARGENPQHASLAGPVHLDRARRWLANERKLNWAAMLLRETRLISVLLSIAAEWRVARRTRLAH